MIMLYVVVELAVSISLDEAASAMIDLATRLNLGVKSDFNGIRMLVYPGDTVLDVAVRVSTMRALENS